MRTALALITLLALASPAVCDDTTKDIDVLMTRVMRDIPDLASVSVAVVRDGKPYYASAYGWADREQKTRAGARTGYYIASSTKSYTGLACAVLAGRGRLDLDAPISKYLPEVIAD